MKPTKIIILISIFSLSLLALQGASKLNAEESQSPNNEKCIGGQVGSTFVCGIDASDKEGNNVTLIAEELPRGLKIKKGDELISYDELANSLDLRCMPGSHKENDECKEDLDLLACADESVLNATKLGKYYDRIKGEWSLDCKVMDCKPGYYPNRERNACTMECISNNFENSRIVAIENGKCVINSCMGARHIETITIDGIDSQSCELNTRPCNITNGTGEERWVNGGWEGTCRPVIGDPDYPFYDPAREIYVNACGFDYKDTPVTFVFNSFCGEEQGYIPNYNVKFYAGDESVEFGRLSTGAEDSCPLDDFSSSVDLQGLPLYNNRFISGSGLSSKCKYTTRPYNMGNNIVNPSSDPNVDVTYDYRGVTVNYTNNEYSCWINTTMVDNVNCNLFIGDNNKYDCIVVHDSSVTEKQNISYIGTDFGKNACGTVDGWETTVYFPDGSYWEL